MAKTYDVDYDSIQSKINEKTKQQQAEYEACLLYTSRCV